jgi:hypothetical protein
LPLTGVLLLSIVPQALGWIAGVLWQRIETGFSRGYRIAASAESPESADKGGAA